MSSFEAEPGEDIATLTARGLFGALSGAKALLSPEGRLVAITADSCADFRALVATLTPEAADQPAAIRPTALSQVRIRQIPRGGLLAGYRLIEPSDAAEPGPATGLSSTQLHDLRDTLHALSLSLETLAAAPDLPPGEERQALSRHLGFAARRIQETLGHAATPVCFDLAEALATLGETLAPKLAEAGVALTLDLPAAGLWLRGLRGAVLRLAQNLLLNAAVHGRGRQIGLRLTDAAAPTAPNALLQLEVSDDGPGLPADLARWLTEPAEAAGARPDAPTGGHGYGLGIVKEAALQLGARASLPPGGRHRISFELEMARADAGQAEAPGGPADLPPLDGLRIWVVEDNALSADLLTEGLRAAGAAVQAFDGAEALAAARAAGAAPADLMLCDFYLGASTGADLVRGLRGTGFAAPILGLTGDPDASTRARAICAGMTDVLAKPLPLSTLVAALAALHAAPPHRDILDPGIAGELFEDNGPEMTLQFMRRALSEARTLPELCRTAETAELRSALHSALGACAITGLARIAQSIRAIQAEVANGRGPADSLSDFADAITQTESVITKIDRDPTKAVPN